MTERQHANAFGLGQAAEVGDWDPRHTVDRVDAVELERVDDEMEAVRQFLLSARRFSLGYGVQHGFSLIVSCEDGFIVFRW